MFGFVVANALGRLTRGIDIPGILKTESSEEMIVMSSSLLVGALDARGCDGARAGAGAGAVGFVLLTGRNGGSMGLEQRSITSRILTGGVR